jgi:ABC-type bacteriocin/lantibiotic exporter with double-glycine peptidase domain
MKTPIKPVKQSKGYCGPASLKMVMDYYGIVKSQDYWAKQTNTSRKTGCSEREIIKVSEALGFKSYMKQNSTINELRELFSKGNMIIVDWFSPEQAGHYSVVAGFEKKKLLIADPHFGRIIKHDIGWFQERWFDVINDELILKEIIVIGK